MLAKPASAAPSSKGRKRRISTSRRSPAPSVGIRFCLEGEMSSSALSLAAGGHESGEEGVRDLEPALVLGVVLDADEERMVRQLQRLDELAVRGEAGEAHPGALVPLAVLVVELVTVTVALVDRLAAVPLAQAGAFRR